MTLGEKIKQARLEAGLSQRQLCGEEVTRNMLSQIENGTARPSMGTLSYFAARLGKNISWFLEEDAVLSPNQAVMAQARAAFDQKKVREAAKILEDYRSGDPVFDSEYTLLCRLTALELARAALEQGRHTAAAELLEEMDIIGDGYCAESLERSRLLLLAEARPRMRSEICRQLPPMDAELLLRARVALDSGDFDRCGHLLEAAQNHGDALWNFLRGELELALRRFADAAAYYHKAESAYPEKCAVRLERCYLELEDFKQAYYYACKQRER